MTTTREKAVLAKLTIGLPGNSKLDRAETAKVRAVHNTQAARVVKQLWPDLALEPAQKMESQVRAYHAANTLPWADDQRRLLPNAHFMAYATEIKKFQMQFDGLRDDFIAKFDGFLADAKTMLNGMFDADDYPSKEAAASMFRFNCTFDPIPSGADLRIDLQKEELEQLQADLDERVNGATKAAQLDLYRRLAEPIRKMVTVLSDPEAKFKNTLVENLAEVCEMIPKLSLGHDPILSALVDQAHGLTQHAPEELRKDTRVRSDVAKRADEIAQQMKGFWQPE